MYVHTYLSPSLLLLSSSSSFPKEVVVADAIDGAVHGSVPTATLLRDQAERVVDYL